LLCVGDVVVAYKMKTDQLLLEWYRRRYRYADAIRPLGLRERNGAFSLHGDQHTTAELS